MPPSNNGTLITISMPPACEALFGFARNIWTTVQDTVPIACAEVLSLAETHLVPQARSLLEKIAQARASAPILVFITVTLLVMVLCARLGFGPKGIIAGSLAAAFQGAAYGGFTPAGGLFAILTSMGMLGVLGEYEAGAAVLLGSVAAGVTWWLIPA